MTGSQAASVDEILDLYERFGDDRYDEEISQLEHALQCAALAERAGAAPELVAAALLHDVGHLLDLEAHAGIRTHEDEDLHHEATGARFLAGCFGSEVTAPVALHVRAKRYLVSTDPGYEARLSPASRVSLALQGGPLDSAACRAFERNPRFCDALLLREWDEGGKVEAMALPTLKSYRPLLAACAAG